MVIRTNVPDDYEREEEISLTGKTFTKKVKVSLAGRGKNRSTRVNYWRESFGFIIPQPTPPFPNELPKLILAHSLVLTCGSCGAWVQRLPEFLDSDYRETSCPKCSSENIKFRRGRPYSKKSKSWRFIVENFSHYFDSFTDPSLWNTVVTVPLLEQFEWETYKEWVRAQGWAI